MWRPSKYDIEVIQRPTQIPYNKNNQKVRSAVLTEAGQFLLEMLVTKPPDTIWRLATLASLAFNERHVSRPAVETSLRKLLRDDRVSRFDLIFYFITEAQHASATALLAGVCNDGKAAKEGPLRRRAARGP